MNYVIKMMEDEEELDEFLELAYEIFPNTNINLGEDDTVFLAYIEQELVGFVHIGEKEKYFKIKGMGVKNEYRKQGIGTNLLKESTDQLSGKPIYLKTDTLNPAVRVYYNCGFFMKNKKFGSKCILVKKEMN